MRIWLCDFEISEVCEVFDQLKYDVYEVLEQLVWFESLSIGNFDSDLLLKQNLEKGEKCEESMN